VSRHDAACPTLNPTPSDCEMAHTAKIRSRQAVALAAVGCALGLAACGSVSKTPATAANGHALGIRFAICMRHHGVPSFPDPEDPADVQIPVRLAASASPAFKSAQQACQYLVPRGSSPRATARQKAVALRLAQCMREHGVPNYPDPTYQDGHEIPPSIADPAINPASPAFGAASKRCQSP
jgi:hypothetical protein